MAQMEPYVFHWDKFSKGIMTAVDAHLLPSDALAAGLNMLPHKHAYLASRPQIKLFASDYSSMSPYYLTGTPEKVVGTYAWQPISGREIFVVAVYGDWDYFGGKGTVLIMFFDPADETDHGSYQDIEGIALTFIRGDAPVKFTTYPMTNPDTFRRSNWLVVCSPYDYARVIEYNDVDFGYEGKTIWLPYFWTDVIVHQRRLVGIGHTAYPWRLYYSRDPDSVDAFNSLDVGEETGDPNLGLAKIFNLVYVLKSKSTWVLAGDTPEKWTAQRVLSKRGTCVHIPVSANLGIIGCDEQGLYHTDGQFENDAPLGQAMSELRGNPHDLIAFHDLILISSKGDPVDYPQTDFYAGSYSTAEIEIVNIGTTEVPIYVLTLAHPAASSQDEQTGEDNWKKIDPTQEEYQTFKESATPVSSRYWATGLTLKLQKNGADKSDLWVELVQYTGSHASPDTEEILAGDLIEDIDASADKTITFDLPILIRCDEYKYMIRVLGVTNATDLRYNSAGGYADGEASWNAAEDAYFKVLGFQYVSEGTWQSPFFDCFDVTRWGALLYNALNLDEDWEARIELKYRYRQGDSGPVTEWQTFIEKTGYTPDGGALSNEFDPAYDQIQFQAKLVRKDQIPPFIYSFLITFSRVIDELSYPSGLEDLGRLYLSGVGYENIHLSPTAMKRNTIVNQDGMFLWYQTDLACFVLWRGLLWAGKVKGSNAGSVVRVMREEDDDCTYDPVHTLLESGYQGQDDPRDKQLWWLRLVWIQYKGFIDPYYTITIEVITDKTSYPMEIKPEDREVRDLGDDRLECTARLSFQDNVFTRECAIKFTAASTGKDDSISFPLIQFKEATIFAEAIPETEAVA